MPKSSSSRLAVGCHLSSSKGFEAMGRQALAVGATTFQFFTRNPRGTQAKPFTEEAATDADDLARLEHLPGNYYNLHPGSHGGQGLETGVSQIAAALDAVMAGGMKTTVLLETMVGKGNEIGGSFRELRMILDAAAKGAMLGICLDTCHVWDAGYDIANRLDEVLEEFDGEVGLERLKAVHCNDSLNPCGARRDRHAKLGQGAIGLEAFARIINHPALAHLPFRLETPNDLAGYASEITVLRGLYNPASA